MIVFICLLMIGIEIIFSPRLQLTSQKDVLLFYKTGRFTRDYIFLFSL